MDWPTNIENEYPYTDLNQLNLDWFLTEFKKLMLAWEEQARDYGDFRTFMTTQFNALSGEFHQLTLDFQTLEGTVNTFTNFVTNYFANLNVQTEINNKLDAMVLDGTLSALIKPYFDAFTVTIDNRMNSQDGRITLLESRMDGFEALSEGSTTGDAELMDIRIGYDGTTYPTAGDAVRGQVSDLADKIDLVADIVVEEDPQSGFPKYLNGIYKVNVPAGDTVFCGTENVISLIGIAQVASTTVKGVTITVSGNTISMDGTASGNISWSLTRGADTSTDVIRADTLAIPDGNYSLSAVNSRIEEGSARASLLIRGKSSGNVVGSQASIDPFTYDHTTCGGIVMYMQSGRTYHQTVVMALLPYTTSSTSNPYRTQTSAVSRIQTGGIMTLNGYTWLNGSPTISNIKSKMPKKCKCVYSTRSVPYTGADQVLDIYIPAKKGYINYVMAHTVGVGSHANLWRLVQIDAVSEAYSRDFHITQLGETEMALKIRGRSDFIGGFTHGDEQEIVNSLYVTVDGETVDVTTLTTIQEFNELHLFQVTAMYDPNDDITFVGYHGKEYIFTTEGMQLNQTVTFDGDWEMDASYMPMICALRGRDDDSPVWITNKYIDDGNWMVYDIGTAGFTTYPNQATKGIHEVNMMGTDTNLQIQVKYLEYPEGLNGSGRYVYNVVNTYNKLYYAVCGLSNQYQQVHHGDKWSIKTLVNIMRG